MTKSSACFISIKCSRIGTLFIAIQLREKIPGFKKNESENDQVNYPRESYHQKVTLHFAKLQTMLGNRGFRIQLFHGSQPLTVSTEDLKAKSGHIALQSIRGGRAVILQSTNHTTCHHWSSAINSSHPFNCLNDFLKQQISSKSWQGWLIQICNKKYSLSLKSKLSSIYFKLCCTNMSPNT